MKKCKQTYCFGDGSVRHTVRNLNQLVLKFVLGPRYCSPSGASLLTIWPLKARTAVSLTPSFNSPSARSLTSPSRTLPLHPIIILITHPRLAYGGAPPSKHVASPTLTWSEASLFISMILTSPWLIMGSKWIVWVRTIS